MNWNRVSRLQTNTLKGNNIWLPGYGTSLESSYAHISDDYVIFSFINVTIYYVNDKSSISFLLT